MRGGDPRGRDEAARQGEKITSRHRARNELLASGAGKGDAGRRQLGHHCDRIAAVVAEAGKAEGVGLGEIIGQRNGVKKRPLRVGGILSGQREDRLKAAGATGRDDQDAETIGIVAVLEEIVELGSSAAMNRCPSPTAHARYPRQARREN